MNDDVKKPEHKCFKTINDALRPHNARIATGLSFTDNINNMSVARYLLTAKIDSRARSKKPPMVIISHCPFCGVKLSEVDSV